MNLRKIGMTVLCCCAIVAAPSATVAQTMTKSVVADKIRRVEDGVDEFRKNLERRGDNARDTASTEHGIDHGSVLREAALALLLQSAQPVPYTARCLN